MKKSFSFLIGTTVLAAAGMYGYNKYVEGTATKKNLLPVHKGSFYTWKNNRIFYTRLGEGKPILLIHDINITSCSKEWTGIRKLLAKTHTVYTIDLPGCGRSDKPKFYYTNYMYASLIRDFIRDIIKEKTDVVSSNKASSIVLSVNRMTPDQFDRIILINPDTIVSTQKSTCILSKYAAAVLTAPVLGTFIYNMMTRIKVIDHTFRSRYYEDHSRLSVNLEECFYEAAHLGNGNGKYLNASILTNYTNMDMSHIAETLEKPVAVLTTKEIHSERHYDTLHEQNENFLLITLPNGKLYPHLEMPQKVTDTINQLTE